MKIFSLYSNYLFPQNKVVVVSESERKRERERDKRERSDVDWSEDARAEKKERGERFVGGDREVRRYLFPTYSSEIAFERCEILARSEYGDEKVD